MAERPLVILLGDSLLMEGVAVSLANCPQIAIIRFDCSVIDIWEQVITLEPDMVIFELKIPHSPLILSLVKEKPGMRMIAIDLDSSQVIVLSSRQHHTRSMHDLYQIVEAEVGEQLRSSFGEELAESLAQTRSGMFPASAP